MGWGFFLVVRDVSSLLSLDMVCKIWVVLADGMVICWMCLM
jgi:hypothetical protein